jgi:hypothetical protein
MKASAILCALCAAGGLCATPLRAETRDPLFSRVPFDEWLKEKNPHSPFSWSAAISEPRLSTQQRLFSIVEFRVDGREVARRGGGGRLLMLTQITGEKGGVWQHHYVLGVEAAGEHAKASDYQYIQPFFAIPGDYIISMAVFDARTSEHSVRQRKLHVPGLRNDPLPGAWEGLPAIEFLTPGEAPDIWFLPEIEGRLHVAAITKKDVEIDLFVNFTPSERLSGSVRARNNTMAVLLPAWKVMSQVRWGGAQLNFQFLDLVKNQILFAQNNATEIDWNHARIPLAEPPGIIDVKSLANHRYSADFFVQEISRKAAEPPAAGHSRVIVVLSSAVRFGSAVELNPLRIAPVPGQKVFYFRYSAPRVIFVPRNSQSAENRTSRGEPPPMDEPPLPYRLGPESDQLEPLLKGLNPQLFDFSTPGQFRKALARLIAAVDSM